MTERAQTAGEKRRAQIQSQARPSQIITATDAIVEAARKAQIEDLETPWKIFGKVWLVEWTAESKDETEGREECWDYHKKVFDRKVLPEDARTRVNEYSGRVQLLVRRYNLLGEWKHKEDAELYMEELRSSLKSSETLDSLKMVPRGSREEVKLKEYGTRIIRRSDEAKPQ